MSDPELTTLCAAAGVPLLDGDLVPLRAALDRQRDAMRALREIVTDERDDAVVPDPSWR